ncbi:MAG TPA: ATP-binding cassette domain-containing protein [Methanoculleus sp.]|nr:ATP-binding cassette domain-containing protein [Methanoculleus sp.]
MHIIETRDLSYTYRGGIPALDHVNLIIPRHARIAVLGSNGAGKSTLFSLFCGILQPTSGKVLIQGEEVTKKNLRMVRRTVGMVFQNPDDQIFSPTVAEDVAFGPINLGLDAETVAHRVDEALRLLEIEHLADRAPHQLSGGEKKRVALAGVLAMEPQVLVLDEPSSGLDPRGVAELCSFIRTLPEKYGMTVIFSTHHVDLVPEMADTVFVLDDGRVVAQGTPEEVFMQEELLKGACLDVPILARLRRRLQEEGHTIDAGLSYEAMEAAVLGLLEKTV